jgi:hypothetical protein
MESPMLFIHDPPYHVHCDLLLYQFEGLPVHAILCSGEL